MKIDPIKAIDPNKKRDFIEIPRIKKKESKKSEATDAYESCGTTRLGVFIDTYA